MKKKVNVQLQTKHVKNFNFTIWPLVKEKKGKGKPLNNYLMKQNRLIYNCKPYMLKNLNFRICSLVTKNIDYKHTLLVMPGKGKHLFLLWKLNIKWNKPKSMCMTSAVSSSIRMFRMCLSPIPRI